MNKTDAYHLCKVIEDEATKTQSLDRNFGRMYCHPNMDSQTIKIDLILKDTPRQVFDSFELDQNAHPFNEHHQYVKDVVKRWKEEATEQAIKWFHMFVQQGEMFGWD